MAPLSKRLSRYSTEASIWSNETWATKVAHTHWMDALSDLPGGILGIGRER
ncbi:MAG: hypothetical protein ACRDI3_08190 [Actinomycetota bacterium]